MEITLVLKYRIINFDNRLNLLISLLEISCKECHTDNEFPISGSKHHEIANCINNN